MDPTVKPETKRAFAFVVTGYIPDNVPNGHETSFIMPTMHASFAVQPFCRLTLVVSAPGETPESVMGAITGQAMAKGAKPVRLIQ